MCTGMMMLQKVTLQNDSSVFLELTPVYIASYPYPPLKAGVILCSNDS